MTPQEKDLIQGVFDRLARAGDAGKDFEAESFIADQMRRLPGASYGLVQAVVMLEAGLNHAQARITELQHQLDQARAGTSPASGGGFLAGASPWGGASVPRSGPAPQPAAPQQQPMGVPQQTSPWAQTGGGSFLRNAATMAAGVAGGTLIAEGLSSLFGGHRYGGFGGGLGGFGGGFGVPGETVENVTVNNYYDNPDRDTGSDVDDSAVEDASFDDSDNYDSGSDDSFDV